ncbi:MAG: hypothetical protein ACYDC1_04145 [Limisphaerales bacterium]
MSSRVQDDGVPTAMPLPVQGHFRGNHPDIFAEDGNPLAVMRIDGHPELGLHTRD